MICLILELDKISYDYIDEADIYFITYRNHEFTILAQKLGISDIFHNIIETNNGIMDIENDIIYNSEDAENIVEELKELLKDENFQSELFLKSINNINLDNSMINTIDKYFFMLSPESVNEIYKQIKKA